MGFSAPCRASTRNTKGGEARGKVNDDSEYLPEKTTSLFFFFLVSALLPVHHAELANRRSEFFRDMLSVQTEARLDDERMDEKKKKKKKKKLAYGAHRGK